MDTTNEPVAWIDPFDLERLPIYDGWVSGEKTKYVDIPLYTHPAKTLTDGEIVKIFQTTGFWQHSDLVHETDAIEFARAILKKAIEK